MTRTETRRRPAAPLVALVALAVLLRAAPGEAYIGPGAGFALLGSFAVLLVTLLLALAAVLAWPFRALWRALRRERPAKPRIRRLIVVGFDGQDPRLTDRFLAEGKLPNFERLKEMGCYTTLATTFPSLSPVAWSSFSTGTHPGRHNIFDFLDRDPRTYLPRLSSTHLGRVERTLKLGRWRIPLGRPEIRLLRKSQAVWTLLGRSRVWSTVLRVPITFPPERFHGAQLSAMCTPDLLGTQGTFLLFTTRPSGERFKEGGMRLPLAGQGDRFTGKLPGPPNGFLDGEPAMELPLTLELDRQANRARAAIDGQQVTLEPGQLSGYLELSFRAAPGVRVAGLARLMLTEMGEHVSLYVTPLSIDPNKPAMPISHPSYYATYLAKRIGPYCTLGLAEDTWALNEGVIDDQAFLEQTFAVDDERRAMFFTALDRLRRGHLTCVFDATDRIHHMFWRYLEPGHPALARPSARPRPDAIEACYRRNDELVGKVLGRLGKGDVLMVISDHGIASFRRGVNLNAWLREHGYLVLKEGRSGAGEWLADVDWSRTRAFALGLTGVFLNLRGREAEGVVAPGEEAEGLRGELERRLRGLRDDERREVAITDVFDTSRLYHGPYMGNAPDLLVGYNSGYRVSWDCATGMASGPVFEDNVKAWSGDHSVDPRQVPGVFFCNYPIQRTAPSLVDIAPTALELFGLEVPPHMEGRPLFDAALTFGPSAVGPGGDRSS
jgi:predicted AlkP superfamily phosphohydrolase/phosphomutase